MGDDRTHRYERSTAFDSYVRTYIGDLHAILDAMSIEGMSDLIALLHSAYLCDKQVFVMGNGGSATTASHLVCDLSKRATAAGHYFRVIGLTDNMAVFSAYANDDGFDGVFAEQLSRRVTGGDVVIGISASGNSRNVVNAVRLAQSAGAITVGFTGMAGGQLRDTVSLSIHVPSNCMEQVEDVHLMVSHLVCFNLRKVIAADLHLLPRENASLVLQLGHSRD